MKIPGTKSVHVLMRGWRLILVPVLLVFLAVTEIERRPEGMVPCIAATVALGLIVALTQRWLTRSYMVSILPWRRVRLAEAELVLTRYPWRTGIDAQMVQLKVGDKLYFCPLHTCPAAEQEELLQRLKSTCKSCTEQRLTGMPRDLKRLIAVRVPIMLALVFAYLYMVQVYVPVSVVAKETAQYGIRGANGGLYYARAWHRADEAMAAADDLLMQALERPDDEEERVRRAEWYEDMQKVDGFAEKRYTESGLKRALELAYIWYGRAAELGHEQAAVMQLYLRTCGAPPEEVYEDAEGITYKTCAAERLGDALLRMSMETPSAENHYTDEQLSTALELAGRWYYRASSWGHYYDIVMLAYLDSMGVPTAAPEATRQLVETTYRVLSAAGRVPTYKELVALQLCYQYGLGTEKDEPKAEALLRTVREMRKKINRQLTAPGGDE